MANENSIAVDLKLQLDSLATDAVKAGKIVGSGLAEGVKGLGETEMERENRLNADKNLRERVVKRRANKKIEDAYDTQEQKRLNGIADKAARERTDKEKKDSASKISRNQIIRAGIAGLAGVGLNVPGLGAVAALGQISPVAAVVTASLATFGAAIRMTTRAAEEAKRYYAKTLQSGLGTGLTVKQSLLAQAIGVGENEVWQYGAAVSALNDRFSHATKILTETNPVLTMLSWNSSVLEADFKALYATIATDLCPAISLFIEWLDKLIKKLTEDNQGKKYSFDYLDPHSPQQYNLSRGGFAEEYGMKQTGDERGNERLTTNFIKDGQRVSDKYQKQLDKLFNKDYNKGLAALGPDQTKAPPPVAYMKQLPASAWEHMGLVIGGSGTNYAKDAAKNTAKMVQQLEKIISFGKNPAVNFAENMFGLPSLP